MLPDPEGAVLFPRVVLVARRHETLLRACRHLHLAHFHNDFSKTVYKHY